MPDMNLPGAHFQSLVDDLEFRIEECREKILKMQVQSESYQEVVRKLKRAIAEEAAKCTALPTGSPP